MWYVLFKNELILMLELKDSRHWYLCILHVTMCLHECMTCMMYEFCSPVTNLVCMQPCLEPIWLITLLTTVFKKWNIASLHVMVTQLPPSVSICIKLSLYIVSKVIQYITQGLLARAKCKIHI